MHRQEGRGNTGGALLGATIITGKSATMVPGQLINVFTDETITVPGTRAKQPASATEPQSAPPQGD